MKNVRKRRFGDRRDGRRLRSLDPYNALTPYIMKQKNESDNSFSGKVEITEVERYLRRKRIAGSPGIGMLHLFVAAFIRVISQYPGVNRYVVGQRVYARTKIEVIMTVKKAMMISAGETSIKVEFDPGDTINEVYQRINSEVDKIKNEGEETSTDAAAKMLMKMPRLILKFAVFCLTVMDYFGKLPKSLVKASPFHGTMVITDLGSIGLPTMAHHLYNFGDTPLFMAFGTKRRENELARDGTVAERKYIDYTMVLDERICDGFYFSQGYRYFNSLLRDPQQLETAPETVVEDVD